MFIAYLTQIRRNCPPWIRIIAYLVSWEKRTVKKIVSCSLCNEGMTAMTVPLSGPRFPEQIDSRFSGFNQ